MTDAILDTDIVVDLLKDYPPAVDWYSRQNRLLAITPIVWMEAVQGVKNKPELVKVVRVLTRYPIEHTTPSDHEWAMRQLEAFHLSHGIQFQDTLIASVAVRLNVPLYTRNLKHYAPLPNLRVESPYTP